MTVLRNVSAGFRTICLTGGAEVDFAPGQTADVDADEAIIADAIATGWFEPVVSDPLDHDGDGGKGGSLPVEPVALSGKNKAELIEIAIAEGAEIDDSMTVADIKAAIELGRENVGG